ncbi:MAG: hypothetical protein JSS81_22900 [Acidobacteria bacterium]|nr:hypothetical protein [Acidobacteriota bacterium]
MQTIRKLKYLVSGAVLLLALALAASAQTARRVTFQKGRTATVVNGLLPRAAGDYDAYIVRARRGQTLSFRLITDEPDAYVFVFESELLGPDEDMLTPEGERLREWSGALPVTSKYSVQVYGPDGSSRKARSIKYALEISIK